MPQIDTVITLSDSLSGDLRCRARWNRFARLQVHQVLWRIAPSIISMVIADAQTQEPCMMAKLKCRGVCRAKGKDGVTAAHEGA